MNPLIGATLIGGGMQAIGGLLSGFSQGKLSRDQLRLQMKQLGLNERQIEHMISQAERMNRIQSHNIGRVNPMIDAMIQRGTEGARARPDAIRLQPPRINNRYQPGYGGNEAPPPITGLPGLSYEEDPREAARRLAMGGY